MTTFANHPRDGGSYRQNADGTFTQLEATTGERPCLCHPEESPAVEAVEAHAPAAEAEEIEAGSKSSSKRFKV